MLSVFRRIPLVFEVRDLWPESAVALGELSNARAIAWATRLEEACYRRARAIVVVTQGIRDNLAARGIPKEKLHIIPNGANVDLFQFSPQGRERVRTELGLEGKFIAIYAGIFGIAQGLETVVEAARQLQDRPEIHFLLVGDGPKREEITVLAQQYELSNLTLLPAQPRASIPDYLSAADLALVPLRSVSLFEGALPSKIFDAWACARAILLSVDGEARQILETVGGGVFVPPEDSPAMTQAILSLQSAPDEAITMGLQGRAHTVQQYSRTAQAERLAELLESIQ